MIYERMRTIWLYRYVTPRMFRSLMGWDKTRIRNYGIAEAEKGIKRGKRDKTRKKG